MFGFLRRLFTSSPQLTVDGVPYLSVSVKMRLENFHRLDRLARQQAVHGDALVDLALREWLDKHEPKLLTGSEWVGNR